MAKHMKTFDKISREIDYGAGVRYMVIRADLMYDAPDSLLDITTEMTGRDILNSDHPGLNFKELGKRQPMHEDTIYRVFAFKDSEKEVTRHEAQAFTERMNMRMLTWDETVWLHNMLKDLMQWKHSLNKAAQYWISTVDKGTFAYFRGEYGDIKWTEHAEPARLVRCIAKI